MITPSHQWVLVFGHSRITEREGIDFNLASIPADFEPNAQEAFDPVEMKRLYDLGYSMALSGYPWEKFPPLYREYR